jgi:hypothetical protein
MSSFEQRKMHHLFSISVAPALFLLVTALLHLPVSPSHATSTNASIFSNNYGDPSHPLCKRHIQVNADSKTDKICMMTTRLACN